MSSVQFWIPLPVARALPIERVGSAAREYGLLDATLTFGTADGESTAMRVICSIDVAMYLVEQLRRLRRAARARRESPGFGSECAVCAEIVLAAVEAELRR